MLLQKDFTKIMLKRFCRTLLSKRCNDKLLISVARTSHLAKSNVLKNTIYAVSTAPGKAGVAVIRVSGPSSSQIVDRMTGLKAIPEARRATLTRLKDPSTGEILDKAILLFFQAPGSFTGEDCCELHVHGGIAVITSVLNALSKLPKFQLAQPGEFTRRAFLNGKLDLTAVEGLADLIAAETEAQRKQALRQMDGELHQLYSAWRNEIIRMAAYIEAFIDFGEDENIDVDVMNKVVTKASNLVEEIKLHMSDNRKGERLRNGVHVVIVGEPNVGKSSLLNLISQRPAAIVSPIAGTTRDVVECQVNIGGYPVLISDTAGLRQSQDEIEAEGIVRALQKVRLADLVIFVLDSKTFIDNPELLREDLKHIVDNLCKDLGLTEIFNNNEEMIIKRTMIVINKIDNYPQLFDRTNENFQLLSCKNLTGLEDFLLKMKNNVEDLCVKQGTMSSPSITQQRHRIHLVKCVEQIKLFLETKENDLAIAAYHLRKGAEQLGMISGEFTAEDLLDIIFRDFCIGK